MSKKLFCRRPFTWFETSAEPDFDAYLCCATWLPIPVGQLRKSSPREVWNSPTAQEIRKSILDGSFRYCSQTSCPFLASRSGPVEECSEVTDTWLKCIIDNQTTELECGPQVLNCSYDPSCNLACPTCRDSHVVLTGEAANAQRDVQAQLVDSFLGELQTLYVTGSGDPFASPTFSDLLHNQLANKERLPRIHLHTNGQLLTRQRWGKLKIRDAVRSLEVSVDAASEATYRKNRPPGNWATLLENLAFLAELRLAQALEKLRVSFVVQANNWREMPDFVRLAQGWRADEIRFTRIEDWKSMSRPAFQAAAVDRADHPDHNEFLDLLCSPIFDDLRVQLGNLLPLRNSRLDSQPIARSSTTLVTGLKEKRAQIPCHRPWTGFELFDHLGDVRPCCWGKVTCGNVNQNTAEEIWNGPGYRFYREQMLAGDYNAICNRDCPILNGVYEERLPPSTSESALEERIEATPWAQGSPLYLRVVPSIKCNLKCPMCYQLEDPPPSLPEDLRGQLDSWLHEAYEFVILGGEPFLAKPCLDWIRYLEPSRFPNLGLCAITNGLMFDDEVCALVSERHWHWILVSIDAATPDTFSQVRGGSFPQLLASLDRLSEVRGESSRPFELRFGFTLQKSNLSEAVDFLDLCDRYGAVPQYTCVFGDWHEEAPTTRAENGSFLEALEAVDKQLFARGWESRTLAPAISAVLNKDGSERCETLQPRWLYLEDGWAHGEQLGRAYAKANRARKTVVSLDNEPSQDFLIQFSDGLEGFQACPPRLEFTHSPGAEWRAHPVFALASDEGSDVANEIANLQRELSQTNEPRAFEIEIGSSVRRAWDVIEAGLTSLDGVEKLRVHIPYWERGRALSALDVLATVDRLLALAASKGWSLDWSRPDVKSLGLSIPDQLPREKSVLVRNQHAPPDLSVVVPVYNQAHNLPAFIRSLEAQDSARPFEVILVDDGSSDRSLEVSVHLAETSSITDWLVVALERERSYEPFTFSFRAGAARQAGVNRARARRILFLDPDQLVDSATVGEHMYWGGLGFDVVIGDRQLPSGGESTSEHAMWSELRTQALGQGEYWWMSFFTGNASVSRRALLEVGGFDESFQAWGLDDTDLGYRLCRSGCRVWHTPRASVTHLATEASGGGQDEMRKKMLRLGMEVMYRKYLDREIVLSNQPVWRLNQPKHETSHAIGDLVCPVCGWEGGQWAAIEATEETWQLDGCPSCECLGRERLIWRLLRLASDARSLKKMRVIEVGGVDRFGDWARQDYFYRNADVTSDLGTVDYPIDKQLIPSPTGYFHVAVLSAVLSEIPDVKERQSLLRELARATVKTGILVLVDDFDPDQEQHTDLGKPFFHPIRLGGPLVDELRSAGWHASLLHGVAGGERSGFKHVEPAVVAAKDPKAVPYSWSSRQKWA